MAIDGSLIKLVLGNFLGKLKLMAFDTGFAAVSNSFLRVAIYCEPSACTLSMNFLHNLFEETFSDYVNSIFAPAKGVF